mgnify:CR=1 FL=1
MTIVLPIRDSGKCGSVPGGAGYFECIHLCLREGKWLHQG